METPTHQEQLTLLDTFDNPCQKRDYHILHTSHEFTSVCPKTGQPDFGTITIEYIPDRLCLELKALKFYLQAFRQQGIFYEAITNRILDDLVSVCRPRHMKITGSFNIRGGFSSIVTVEYDKDNTR